MPGNIDIVLVAIMAIYHNSTVVFPDEAQSGLDIRLSSCGYIGSLNLQLPYC